MYKPELLPVISVEAKVDEDGAASRRIKNIVRLDVVVHNLLTMNVGEGSRHVTQYLCRVGPSQGAVWACRVRLYIVHQTRCLHMLHVEGKDSGVGVKQTNYRWLSQTSQATMEEDRRG